MEASTQKLADQSWPERLAGLTGKERTDAYHAYLASPEWAVKRAAALGRAGHRCQVCNGQNVLQTHHRTYERIGNEDPLDLTVLCRRCHGLFHDKPNGKKRGVATPPKPKKPKKRPPRKKAFVEERPCTQCGLHRTTKGLCKSCRKKARRAYPKPKLSAGKACIRCHQRETTKGLCSVCRKRERQQAGVEKIREAHRERVEAPDFTPLTSPRDRAKRMRGQWQ